MVMLNKLRGNTYILIGRQIRTASLLLYCKWTIT